MSGESPASVLFSSDGTELAVVSGSPIPAGTRTLLISGRDGYTGDARYVPTSTQGVFGVTNMSNSFPVLSNITINASGSQLITNSYFGTQEVAIVVNVGTVTGAGNITFTIQELDPGDGVTVYGNTASTAAISTGNAPGVFTAVLNISTSPMIKVTWTVAGGAFSAPIYATVVSKSTPSSQTVNGTVAVSSVGGTVAVTQSTSPWVVSGTVTANQGTPNSLANGWPVEITDGTNVLGTVTHPVVVSGTVTATNNSVGADAAAALGFDTQVGGITTTAAPTYTTGNLDALSLTTKGGLRIDGVFPTAAAVPISDAMYVGAAVTTAAPAYTTGQMDPLSLTTLGGLRIDGVYATGTANATAADAIVSGGYVTTAPPTYTTGQLNALSLDTAGNLRTTAITNKAATSTVTSVAVTASANTTLLAANTARIFAAFYNGSNKTCYIKLGTTASTASYTIQLFTGSYWEVPNDYTGNIDEFSPAGASGNVLVTELTP